jgi:hypothetical protein
VPLEGASATLFVRRDPLTCESGFRPDQYLCQFSRSGEMGIANVVEASCISLSFVVRISLRPDAEEIGRFLPGSTFPTIEAKNSRRSIGAVQLGRYRELSNSAVKHVNDESVHAVRRGSVDGSPIVRMFRLIALCLFEDRASRRCRHTGRVGSCEYLSVSGTRWLEGRIRPRKCRKAGMMRSARNDQPVVLTSPGTARRPAARYHFHDRPTFYVLLFLVGRRSRRVSGSHVF